MLSKEREIFKNIYNKKLDKIDELSKKVDYGDFKFIVNSSGLETNCSESKYSVAFLEIIKRHEISIEEAGYKQEKFNRHL